MTTKSLDCESVRELLPEYAESGPRVAGPVELHLASCAACSAELAAYRGILASLSAMVEADVEPDPAFLAETIRAIRVARWTQRLPDVTALRETSLRVATAVKERRPVALASLGGAAVGATAIALIWWRAARRTMESAAV